MLGSGALARFRAGLASRLLSLSKPADPAALVITILLAEDRFSFRPEDL